jgi:predicted RNA-binding protein with TRAM domain
VETERRLRALAASKPRTKAFKIELNAHIAELLIGPGAARLEEIEAFTKRRFFIEGKDGVSHEHFNVLDEGTVEKLEISGAPVSVGKSLELKLVEVGRHDAGAGIGKLDGWSISVGGAAKLVGKKVNVRIERVFDGIAYAALVDSQAAATLPPITAEAQAEKPTRASRAKKPEPEAVEGEVVEEEDVEDVEEIEQAPVPVAERPASDTPPKKKMRRGSRGGRGRKKPAAAAAAGAPLDAEGKDSPQGTVPEVSAGESAPEVEAAPEQPAADQPPRKKTRRGSRGGRGRKKPTAPTNGRGDGPVAALSTPTIHVPAVETETGTTTNGDAPAAPRKKTRRGSRGGRRRRKPAGASTEAPATPGPDES